MIFGIWQIGIPKDTLIAILDSMDADADGFVTVGEARDILKRYAKEAKKSLKPGIIQRRKG